MDLTTADDPLSSHVLGELKEAEAECLRDAIKNVSICHIYTRWSFLTEASNWQWLLSWTCSWRLRSRRWKRPRIDCVRTLVIRLSQWQRRVRSSVAALARDAIWLFLNRFQRGSLYRAWLGVFGISQASVSCLLERGRQRVAKKSKNQILIRYLIKLPLIPTVSNHYVFNFLW